MYFVPSFSENSTCVVVIMSTSPIIPRSPSEVPSDNNPSVDQNLLRSRTYRQYGDGFTWEANPVPQEKVHSTLFSTYYYLNYSKNIFCNEKS